MQIGNDYNAYQNQSYGQSHAHHITECMHEEKQKKREGSIGSSNQTSTYQKGDAAKAAVEYIASFSMEEISEDKGKKGVGMLRGFWDSLGENKKGTETFNFRQSIANGIHAATMTVEKFFADKVVHRFVTVREKIKAVPTSALRKFGKGKEAFGALLGGNTAFHQKNPESKEQNKEEKIPTGEPDNNHLMDSYSRTGQYCQLHENLTYQKPKANDHKG